MDTRHAERHTKQTETKRNTAALIRADLEADREAWLEEAPTVHVRQEWESTDFLKHEDSRGRTADFHGLRHTYITNLAAANVPAAKAQKLARHSTFDLTQKVYHHFENLAEAEEIAKLAGPPKSVDARKRSTS